MLNRLVSLFRAVLVAAIFFSGTADAAHPLAGRIVSCIDGDTLVLQTYRKIRLAGIDTPEKASEKSPAQYYAHEAQELTKALTLNRNVRLVPLPGRGKDRYGRLVAELYLPDGTSLNEQLLKRGAAYFYDHKDLTDSMRARFLAAQRFAMEKRNGFWKYVLERPEAGENFIGNKKRRRFFSVPCSRKIRIAQRNRIVFPDLESAFKQGYAPARFCSIWPDA